MARVPPNWSRELDGLARECNVETITFRKPVSASTACHYCGGAANNRDHIVPDSAGGVRLWWNLVPACSPCNEQKADRQSCSCLFCLRAMALWHMGYRNEGVTRGQKKAAARRRAREKVA